MQDYGNFLRTYPYQIKHNSYNRNDNNNKGINPVEKLNTEALNSTTILWNFQEQSKRVEIERKYANNKHNSRKPALFTKQ